MKNWLFRTENLFLLYPVVLILGLRLLLGDSTTDLYVNDTYYAVQSIQFAFFIIIFSVIFFLLHYFLRNRKKRNKYICRLHVIVTLLFGSFLIFYSDMTFSVVPGWHQVVVPEQYIYLHRLYVLTTWVFILFQFSFLVYFFYKIFRNSQP